MGMTSLMPIPPLAGRPAGTAGGAVSADDTGLSAGSEGRPLPTTVRSQLSLTLVVVVVEEEEEEQLAMAAETMGVTGMRLTWCVTGLQRCMMEVRCMLAGGGPGGVAGDTWRAPATGGSRTGDVSDCSTARRAAADDDDDDADADEEKEEEEEAEDDCLGVAGAKDATVVVVVVAASAAAGGGGGASEEEEEEEEVTVMWGTTEGAEAVRKCSGAGGAWREDVTCMKRVERPKPPPRAMRRLEEAVVVAGGVASMEERQRRRSGSVADSADSGEVPSMSLLEAEVLDAGTGVAPAGASRGAEDVRNAAMEPSGWC